MFSDIKNIFIIYIFFISLLFPHFSMAETSPDNHSPDEELRLEKECDDALAFANITTYSDGIQAMEDVTAKNPQNYVAFKKLAFFYMADGGVNPDGTVKLKPLGPIPGSPLGSRFIMFVGDFKPGALDNAENAIKHALQINPGYHLATLVQGNIYLQKSDLTMAKIFFTIAENSGVTDPNLQLYWADFYLRSGDLKSAFARCMNVLNRSNIDKEYFVSAYNYLITGYKAYDDYAKVDEYYKKVFELKPKDGVERFSYARYLLDTIGDYDKAIRYAREAVKLQNFGLHKIMLAKCLYAKWADLLINNKKSPADAEKYFQEAQALDPDLNQVMAEEAIHPELKNLIKALQSRGISINAPDTDGSTALIIASNVGRTEGVKLLLDFGADTNAQTNDGWTSLFGAAMSGNVEITKMLLDKGANPQQIYNGSTVASYAETQGHPDVSRVVREYTAKH